MLIPVILCGGVGSRLWPVSRDSHPKPFIKLPDGQSLLQKAFLRGAEQQDVAEILTVTNRDLFFKIEDAFKDTNTGGLATSYILEPFGRNTAAAIAAAAVQLKSTHGEQAVMLVLAADHVITEPAAFSAAVNNAVLLAEKGQLVTFGITPASPETGYGYIEASGTDVLRFVEKPSSEVAQQYLDAGNFYWNSGMFCFRVGDILNALGKHCPDILHGVESCLAVSRRSTGKGFQQTELDSATFTGVPDISIDYAVMEKAENVSVVISDFGWDDVGSWGSLSKTVAEDSSGNAIEGRVILHDVHNTYIRSESRLVAAVGVSGLVVIDTDDAVLVSSKERSQEVKEVYARLKAAGDDLHSTPSTVERPWGKYTVIEQGPGFKIKRIEVLPGRKLSLQSHKHRSEHWVVVSGLARVENNDQILDLSANESTYIQVGHKHRLENPGTDDLIIIEVQCGDYLGEDDIKRYEDIYGRAL